MHQIPQIRPLGEKAILVRFSSEVNEELLNRILALRKLVLSNGVKRKLEVITSYDSLLVVYHDAIEDVYEEAEDLKKLIDEANIEKRINRTLFHIPVCYDEEFGVDLDHISAVKNLEIEEIVALHTSPVYTVYFIGFLPGFLYLGGLDERLQIARRNEPRLRVKRGAVGIGQNQTGIYPQESPGGWQLIGNSPVPLFDKNEDPPCEISAGDKIKFYGVGLKEYEQIEQEVRQGTFQFRKQVYDS